VKSSITFLSLAAQVMADFVRGLRTPATWETPRRYASVTYRTNPYLRRSSSAHRDRRLTAESSLAFHAGSPA
jgi:hypothetical protein